MLAVLCVIVELENKWFGFLGMIIKLNAHDLLKLLMMKQILLPGDDEVQAVELVPEEVDGLLLAENLRHRRPENVFSIVVETVLFLLLLIIDDIPSRQLLHYGPNLPLASNLV